MMSSCRKKSILQNVYCKGGYIFLYFIIYLLYWLLIFTSFTTPNAVHCCQCSTPYTVHKKNVPKFTMTQKVYFYDPKYTFNPDPIYMQIRNGIIWTCTETGLSVFVIFYSLPKYNNVKIVISEVYASFVLQCTVSGR